MHVDVSSTSIAKGHRTVRALPLLVCLLIAAPTAMLAREPRTTDPLLQTIAGLDAALFAAYNACDLATLGTFVVDDLEFYHDVDGLSVGRDIFLESTRKNICGKVARELVPGTLEVYPLGRSGALATGVHRFHHPGRDDVEPVGEAKFIIIWQQQEGAWKMTRVISYEHRPSTK